MLTALQADVVAVGPEDNPKPATQSTLMLDGSL
jgi:hypothetical protein